MAGTTRDNQPIEVAVQLCAWHAKVFGTARRRSSRAALTAVAEAITATADGSGWSTAGNNELARAAQLSERTTQHAILVLRVLGKVVVRYDLDTGERILAHM